MKPADHSFLGSLETTSRVLEVVFPQMLNGKIIYLFDIIILVIV